MYAMHRLLDHPEKLVYREPMMCRGFGIERSSRSWAISRMLLATLFFMFCTTSIAQGTPSNSEKDGTHVDAMSLFEFHSDPWINLHHFLYQWARYEEGIGSGRKFVSVPECSSLAALPKSAQRGWLEAISFYRESTASRSHYDTQMLEEKRALLNLHGDLDARPPDAIPGMASALRTAMPIYQVYWWPAHDRANRAWIASVVPIVRRHEAEFVQTTQRIYGAEWSKIPRRVDVSAYANARAGYTAEGHTVIYSTDTGNQHLYGVETLFHEVQHTSDVGAHGRRELARAFVAAGVKEPKNLWHALIFATASTFVQSIAVQEGLPPHVPYWSREHFENLRGWHDVVPAVRELWVPVVLGDSSPEEGFAALVRLVGKSSE